MISLLSICKLATGYIFRKHVQIVTGNERAKILPKNTSVHLQVYPNGPIKLQGIQNTHVTVL